jgi:hypothetical protein
MMGPNFINVVEKIVDLFFVYSQTFNIPNVSLDRKSSRSRSKSDHLSNYKYDQSNFYLIKLFYPFCQSYPLKLQNILLFFMF